ncbi:hypothetical protein T484DRAFT_1918622, partial [Baffinella frigidus]
MDGKHRFLRGRMTITNRALARVRGWVAVLLLARLLPLPAGMEGVDLEEGRGCLVADQRDEGVCVLESIMARSIRAEQRHLAAGLDTGAVVAVRGINRGDVVMRVPINCTIGVDAVEQTGLGDMFRSESFQSVALAALAILPTQMHFSVENFGIVLVLMVEAGRGNRSPWASYLASLPAPEDCHSPLLWAPEQLQWLLGTGLLPFRYRTLRAVHGLWNASAPWLAGRDGAGAGDAAVVGEEALLGAWVHFAARHFIFANSDASAAEGAGGRAQVALMVPGLDAVNHCGGVRGRWRVQRSGSGGQLEVVLEAGRPFATGDEVCHSYSMMPSAETFLLQYGGRRREKWHGSLEEDAGEDREEEGDVMLIGQDGQSGLERREEALRMARRAVVREVEEEKADGNQKGKKEEKEEATKEATKEAKEEAPEDEAQEEVPPRARGQTPPPPSPPGAPPPP